MALVDAVREDGLYDSRLRKLPSGWSVMSSASLVVQHEDSGERGTRA